MPTILRLNGYRFFFYSQENNEPVHIHVEYGSNLAKFWINPVRLAKNSGLNSSELKKAALIIEAHQNLVQEKWNEFFAKKI